MTDTTTPAPAKKTTKRTSGKSRSPKARRARALIRKYLAACTLVAFYETQKEPAFGSDDELDVIDARTRLAKLETAIFGEER